MHTHTYREVIITVNDDSSEMATINSDDITTYNLNPPHTYTHTDTDQIYICMDIEPCIEGYKDKVCICAL